jgi:3-oxoadipate enol-lactonase
MFWLGLRTRVGSRRARRRAFVRLVTAPGAATDPDALAEQLEPLFGHDLGDQPPIAWKQLKALRAYTAAHRLGDLAGVPTLVVNAAHDPISPPRVSRAIAEGIPWSRYEEFADASHGLPITHAERVNELLAEHLAAAETRSAQATNPVG